MLYYTVTYVQMGIYYSKRNILDIKELKDFYLSSGNFSNTYQPLNHRYFIGLNKFAQKVDPFMHYQGKSVQQKENLKKIRRSKSKENLFLLQKTWELYLLSQRLTDWGDLSHVKNKKKVSETIQLFLKTRHEIIKLLI